ncbi:DUF6115 domain-containing protein [Brachyspira aalborgi]|uniref:DUF6115 domain-containing protein n=1 Tax=Brachyspira aalborgi TaxID=29522 RepID=UPI0026659171|nr:hypothetical protein [Brachyspira aalborgi]
MQILISVIINIIILAVALPLFYIYIVSRVRERLERETTSKAREEIEALVKEFNNIALSRISILEDAINRADELLKKMNIDNQDNNNEVKSKNHTNNLNIKIEDIENLENVNNINNKKIENKNINDNDKIKENKENEIKKENIKEFSVEFNSGLNKDFREELKNKLDIAFKKNIYNKIDKTENKNDNIENQKTINENIIKLYKEGFSKEEISKKLNCAITEIDIVIDMENIKK